MFDVNTFFDSLNTKWVGRHFWYFKELGSTNAYIKAKHHKNTAHGLTCLADTQNQGRGQYGRQWEAEPGQNLTFTIVFKPAGNDCLQTLNLMCAYSACEVFNQSTALDFSLKWPNDLYFGEQKIGGLLTETSFTGTHLDRILLGVGLNINQRNYKGELKKKASSLSLINNNGHFSREILLARILTRIEQNYTAWDHQDDRLVKNINRKLLGYGSWVKLQVNGSLSDKSYKLLGVNTFGYLYVLSEDDDVKKFTHEEVRIHPITGSP